MDYDNDLFKHHQALLEALYQHCCAQPPFCLEGASDTDRELLATLDQLRKAPRRDETFNQQGRNVLTQIVGHYPHITPEINRDLFWFFGGDCLHYMGDEEIRRYQELDEWLHERRQAGEEVSFADARASIFQLH